jgi:hypothetical protein
MLARKTRRKISTTVSVETGTYLESLIRRGKAANLAEALDSAVGQARRLENRARLAQDTAAYFQSLQRPATTDESGVVRLPNLPSPDRDLMLEVSLGALIDEVNFDD